MTDWFGSQKEAWQTGYDEGCAVTKAEYAKRSAKLKALLLQARDKLRRIESEADDACNEINLDLTLEEADNPASDEPRT